MTTLDLARLLVACPFLLLGGMFETVGRAVAGVRVVR